MDFSFLASLLGVFQYSWNYEYPTYSSYATVWAKSGFSAWSAAGKLRSAMKGWGTDEDDLIDVLTSHNSRQRVDIASTYRRRYGSKRILWRDIRDETSGNFERALIQLTLHPIQVDALGVYEAMRGGGTDEDTLIEIFASRTYNQINLIKNAYNRASGRSLTADLEDETSGGLQTLLLLLTTIERPTGDSINQEEAASQAQDLYLTGRNEAATAFESKLIRILASHSYPQLRTFFAQYRDVAGVDIKSHIASKLGGWAKTACLSVVRYAKDPVSFFAERFKSSMEGGGTNDEMLIRLAISRSEIDMQTIKSRYYSKYRRSLIGDVRVETSGDYEKLLVELIN